MIRTSVRALHPGNAASAEGLALIISLNGPMYFLKGHLRTICSTVCSSAPQSQAGESPLIHHGIAFCMLVLILLRLLQVLLLKSNPGRARVGSVMSCW